ncbi:MAG: beta-ketoacyl-[acyl-carrier-protein] synthase family protein [Lentisphaerae bacterium]|nr:beta-ketoacyl-[acyl-carrier-protein] synthase family protein [Lentisphaerota bacterium]
MDLIGMEKVFITGRGLVTPLGNGLAANEAALRTGKSGIVFSPEFKEHQLDSVIAGIPDQNPEVDFLDRKTRRFCPPSAVMSVAAAAEAFAQAGIPLDEVRNYDMALVGGQASSNAAEIHSIAQAYIDRGYSLRAVSPFAVPRIMPSGAISVLSLLFGITGESFDVSAACATSALSVIQAARLIRSGEYDMVLVGGAEQIDWTAALGFCGCRALATKYNDEPERASRPFSASRDGFVLAGGAAYMLLESERSVRKRGVKPVCEISGFAGNSSATDMVVPNPESSAGVMAKAIASAGLTISDIDYVNTHGTATAVGDKVEIEAIRTLVGSGKCPAINSTKSQTGHMVGATGAAEVIFSSLMVEKGFISPSINCEDLDPEFADVDIVREYRECPVKHAISNSFAFGGSNACVVISRCEM